MRRRRERECEREVGIARATTFWLAVVRSACGGGDRRGRDRDRERARTTGVVVVADRGLERLRDR